jgi:hypothetical protein
LARSILLYTSQYVNVSNYMRLFHPFKKSQRWTQPLKWISFHIYFERFHSINRLSFSVTLSSVLILCVVFSVVYFRYQRAFEYFFLIVKCHYDKTWVKEFHDNLEGHNHWSGLAFIYILKGFIVSIVCISSSLKYVIELKDKSSISSCISLANDGKADNLLC